MQRRIVYVLIGPPAIGKSTWINKMTDPLNTFVINNDDVVEAVAESYGWAYDDMFVFPPNDAELGDIDEKYGTVEPAPESMYWRKTIFSKVSEANQKANGIFLQMIESAKKTDKNIVVDLTNMKIKFRIDILDKIYRPGDIRIAVVFKFEGKEKVIQAVAKRRAEAAERMGKSKTIPGNVISRMVNGYQPPSPQEKYDKIISSDTIEQLKKAAGLNEVRLMIRKIISEL